MDSNIDIDAAQENVKALKFKLAAQKYRDMNVKRYEEASDMLSHYGTCQFVKKWMPRGGEVVSRYCPVPPHQSDAHCCPGCAYQSWVEACRLAGVEEFLSNKGRYGTPYAKL